MYPLIRTKTQKQIIRDHLESGKTLTPMHAFMVYGIARLASRIDELRNDGMKIDTIIKEDEAGRKYAEYKVAGQLKVGCHVTVKAGQAWGLPKWVRRTKPSRVVGLLQDVAYVEFVRGTRMEVIPMNRRELNHVA